VWRRLRKWKISWKCGRIHLVSPDPEYESKVAAIRAIRSAAEESHERLRVLYSDEASFYRLPHGGRTYAASGGGGKTQPTATHAPGANTRRRMIGALDIHDGCVLSRTGSVIGVKEISRFLRQIRRHYGPDVRLVLIWDNWPVHYHPEVLSVAKEQSIELLYIPTYAPWCNPIEKLWKKLRREVLCLHDRSGAWKQLRAAVEKYLDELCRSNPDLLRYTGLAKALPA
jgi:transposase